MLGRLQGWCVLVAEDSFLIANDLARRLTEAGAQVLGPFADLASAHRALDAHTPPKLAAILDVQLRDGLIYGLADRLAELGAPMVFATGYDKADLRAPYDAYPFGLKSMEAGGLLYLLAEALEP
ncbi:response regulator [Phenylobacterium deserti]|uniref:Response regulator n=1 Tax=Phenylobacterium deserti TaxID=1914756 RepID=A0A328AN91_9CAUL|nr:response regulator [Phenylobacterium deserti]